MKENNLPAVVNDFTDTNVTAEGRTHLEEVVGPQLCIDQFVRDNIQHWKKEFECLVSVAHTQPHAAMLLLPMD